MNSTYNLKTNCSVPWILDPQRNRPEIIILLSIQCVLLLPTLILNSAEFLVIWNSRECVGTKKPILLNLCTADLLHGLTTQTVYIAFLAFQLRGETICILAEMTNFSSFLLTEVSILALFLASIERYLCIIHPFVYQRYEENRFWLIAVMLSWAAASASSILLQLNYNMTPALGTVIVLGCLSIAFMYTRILIKALKIRKQIQHQSEGVGNTSHKQTKTARIIALLVLFSLISYTPFSYCLFFKQISECHVSRVTSNFFWCLLTVNAIVDPLCYCILNKTLRKDFLKMFKIC